MSLVCMGKERKSYHINKILAYQKNNSQVFYFNCAIKSISYINTMSKFDCYLEHADILNLLSVEYASYPTNTKSCIKTNESVIAYV